MFESNGPSTDKKLTLSRMLLKLGTGNGDGERGTGNGERVSGNECTVVIPIRNQNGGRNDVNTDMKGKLLPLARSRSGA